MAQRVSPFLPTALLGSSLTALALVACTSSSTAPPSVGQATSDYANVYCARLGACSPLYFQARFGDMPGCLSVSTATIAQAAMAPGTGANGATIEACAQAYAAADCSALAASAPPLECQFAGTVADGAGCAVGAQCASGQCVGVGVTGSALPDGGVLCGACAPYVAAGARCGLAEDSCGPGFACISLVPTDGGASPPATCIALAQEGDPCGGGTRPPCDAQFMCIGQKCSAPLQAGAACDPFADTCDRFQALSCSVTSRTCTALVLAAPGAPCGDANGVTATCAGLGAQCAPTEPGGTAMTCMAPIPAGHPCAATQFCEIAATCVNGVCAVGDPTACH